MTQTLFFCLIPIGLAMLVLGLRFVVKSFNGPILLEISFEEKSGNFFVSNPGMISIWLKAGFFRRIPVERFMPKIYREFSNEAIELDRSVLRPRSNIGRSSRIEVFTFEAGGGKYRVEIVPGTSVGKLETAIGKLMPGRAIDLAKCFVQIREGQSARYLVLGIFMIIFGFLFAVGGFMLGTFADQIIQ